MHDDLLSSHDTSSIVEDGTTSAKPDAAGATRRPSAKTLSHADDPGDKSPTKEKMSITTGQLLRGPTVRKSTLEAGTVRPTILPGRTGVVTGMVLPSASVPRAAPAPLPSLRYASAAAAASSPASTGVPANTTTSSKNPGSVPPTPHCSDSISAPGPPLSSSLNPPTDFSSSPKKQTQQLPQRPFSAVASPETKKSLPPTTSSKEPGVQSSPPNSDHSPVPHDSNSNSQMSDNGISSASLGLNPSHSTQSAQSMQSIGGSRSVQESDRSPSPSNSHVSTASHAQPEGNVTQHANAEPSEMFKSNFASTSMSSPPGVLPPEDISTSGFVDDATQDGTHGAPHYRHGRSLDSSQRNGTSDTERHLTSDNKHVTCLADLVDTFEGLKAHMPSMREMHDTLDAGLSSMPQIQDAEKPSYYAPRNPYPTSSHYPQQPMAFEKRPSIWGEIEVEVLFYLFYYHQGGYLQ